MEKLGWLALMLVLSVAVTSCGSSNNNSPQCTSVAGETACTGHGGGGHRGTTSLPDSPYAPRI